MYMSTIPNSLPTENMLFLLRHICLHIRNIYPCIVTDKHRASVKCRKSPSCILYSLPDIIHYIYLTVPQPAIFDVVPLPPRIRTLPRSLSALVRVDHICTHHQLPMHGHINTHPCVRYYVTGQTVTIYQYYSRLTSRQYLI